MMDNGRNNSGRPGRDNEDKSRKVVMNRRDEQLDEEIRGQLRKKNEESRKHMNDGTERDEMNMD